MNQLKIKGKKKKIMLTRTRSTGTHRDVHVPPLTRQAARRARVLYLIR